MGIIEEINSKTKEFRSDSYPMSLGEMINLYKNNEIFINPDFQRYYRWTPYQKTRFVESILLGIPTPPIFVYQREDGIWELVDGLQRVSTILEFTGNLRNQDGKVKPPLILEGTKMVPGLKGIVWEKTEDNTLTLPDPLKLHFKRSKIKIEIIQKESDVNAKFEVFERLNTGGSFLSFQEVRNCLLIMINKEVYNWLSELAKNQDFQDCLSITDRLLQERYDMELALRYLALTHFPLYRRDVNEYLTDSLMEISKNIDFDLEGEKLKFDKIFNLLNLATGEDTFKKFDGSRFKGKFLESAYEAITVGLFENFDQWDHEDVNLLRSKIEKMWIEEDFTSSSGSGSNAQTRIPRLIPFGQSYFRHE
jgi:hypothetical protein